MIYAFCQRKFSEPEQKKLLFITQTQKSAKNALNAAISQ